MSTAQKELIDFIEAQYNVAVTVEQGGKHAKLRWTYDDRNYTYAVTRNSNAHARSHANSIAYVKRLMKQTSPELEPKHHHKTMDELMDDVRNRAVEHVTSTQPPREETYIPPPPEPKVSSLQHTPEPAETQHQPSPARTWLVTVCCYEATTSARKAFSLIFPPEIMDVMPNFSIEKLDEEHWQLRPGGKRTFYPYYHGGKKARLTLREDCEPFSAIRVEALDVDGEILIYVPLDRRRSPVDRRSLPKPQYPVETSWEPEDSVPQPTLHQLRQERERITQAMGVEVMQSVLPKLDEHGHDRIIQTLSLEDEMRQLLRKIRAIEDTTPYTLTARTRPNGATRWVWSAPEIE